MRCTRHAQRLRQPRHLRRRYRALRAVDSGRVRPVGQLAGRAVDDTAATRIGLADSNALGGAVALSRGPPGASSSASRGAAAAAARPAAPVVRSGGGPVRAAAPGQQDRCHHRGDGPPVPPPGADHVVVDWLCSPDRSFESRCRHRDRRAVIACPASRGQRWDGVQEHWVPPWAYGGMSGASGPPFSVAVHGHRIDHPCGRGRHGHAVNEGRVTGVGVTVGTTQCGAIRAQSPRSSARLISDSRGAMFFDMSAR